MYADFAQNLIGIAWPLYAQESFGVDLQETVCALYTTTGDDANSKAIAKSNASITPQRKCFRNTFRWVSTLFQSRSHGRDTFISEQGPSRSICRVPR
jgi:hypothetical protein